MIRVKPKIRYGWSVDLGAYVTSGDLQCWHCGRVFSEECHDVFLVNDWRRHDPFLEQFVLCAECVRDEGVKKKLPLLGFYREWVFLLWLPSLPEDFVPNIKTPVLKYSRNSDEIAFRQDSSRVVDRTRWAGRGALWDDSVSVERQRELLERQDRLLDSKLGPGEVGAYLEMLKSARPVIEGGVKEGIEDKRGDEGEV